MAILNSANFRLDHKPQSQKLSIHQTLLLFREELLILGLQKNPNVSIVRLGTKKVFVGLGRIKDSISKPGLIAQTRTVAVVSKCIVYHANFVEIELF